MKDYRDPREQTVAMPPSPASIAKAMQAHDEDRIAAGLSAELTEEQHRTLDAQDAIERLAASLGSYARLARLVRNLAAIHGEDINLDRPTSRCLVDGAMLPVSRICPRCGRDNS
jgi:hypothetical protein